MTQSPMTQYLIAPPETLRLWSRVVDALAGVSEPIRGAVHGGPDSLPVEYAGPNTPGWTDAVYRGAWVSDDLTLAAFPVPDSALALAGASAEIDGVIVTLPGLEALVTELPPELLKENGAWWWLVGDPTLSLEDAEASAKAPLLGT